MNFNQRYINFGIVVSFILIIFSCSFGQRNNTINVLIKSKSLSDSTINLIISNRNDTLIEFTIKKDFEKVQIQEVTCGDTNWIDYSVPRNKVNDGCYLIKYCNIDSVKKEMGYLKFFCTILTTSHNLNYFDSLKTFTIDKSFNNIEISFNNELNN